MTTNEYIHMNVKIHLPASKVKYAEMIKQLAIKAANLKNIALFRDLYAEYQRVSSEIFWEN